MASSEQDLLYGITPVMQCLLNQNRRCFTLFVKKDKPSKRINQIVKIAEKNNVPIQQIDAGALGNKVETRQHQGVVLACSALQTFELDEFLGKMEGEDKKLIIALDQIEDPQNFGAIIRSAAFFGVHGVMVVKKHSAPLSPTVSKTSAGALEYLPIISVTNLAKALQQLKDDAFGIYGASTSESLPFNDVQYTDYSVLVMGNEGIGLRQLTEKKCDQLIHIPGNRSTESLNVSNASAILTQYISQQLYHS